MDKQEIKRLKNQIANYEDRIERAQAMCIKREHIELLRVRVDSLKIELRRAGGKSER